MVAGGEVGPIGESMVGDFIEANGELISAHVPGEADDTVICGTGNLRGKHFQIQLPLPYLLAYKYALPISWKYILRQNFVEFIDITPISWYQFLPDQIIDCSSVNRHYAMFLL